MKGKKVLKAFAIILALGILATIVVKNFIPFKIAENVQSIETKLSGAETNGTNGPLTNIESTGELTNWENGKSTQKKKRYSSQTYRIDESGNPELKWLFVDSSNTYKDIYCVQSGSSQDDKYYEYDLYDIRDKYLNNDTSDDPIYNRVSSNTDFREYFFGRNNDGNGEKTFNYFLWILQNMYIFEYTYSNVENEYSSVADNDMIDELFNKIDRYFNKTPGSTKNDYDAMLNEFSTMYSTRYNVNTHGLDVGRYNSGDFGLKGTKVDARDSYIKVIQNYILVCFFNQKNGKERATLIGDNGDLLYEITTEETGYNKNDTPVTHGLGQVTKRFTTNLLTYLQNGYNENDLNKYSNFDKDGNLTSYAHIDKSKAKYDPNTGKIGPFYLKNSAGFDINYKVTYNDDERECSIDDNINLSDIADNLPFYINVGKNLENNKEIKVQFDIDYGYVPDAKILVPNKSVESEDAPQVMINVTKEKITRAEEWSDVVLNDYPDIALKKYIYSVNGTQVPNRLGNIDVTPIKNYDQNRYNDSEITDHNATYNMNKTPVEVNVGDTVTYAIHLFNEGNVNATAKKIKDYLPEGVTFIKAYDKQNRTLNTSVSRDGKTIEITSQYDNMEKYNLEEDENTFLQKSQVIYVDCKVKKAYNKVYTNIAEISQYKVGENIVSKDIDSQANNWSINTTNRMDERWINYCNGVRMEWVNDNGFHSFGAQNIDDDDFDKIKVKQIDLALTKRIERKLGSSEPLKVDGVGKDKCVIDDIADVRSGAKNTLKYSMNKKAAEVNVGDKLVSVITVYNESSVNGIVKEITDYLPNGFTFDAEETARLNGSDVSIEKSGNYLIITLNGDNGITLNALGNNVDKREVKIVTTVNDGASGILYNSAAITQYGYKGADNEYYSAYEPELDRDSYGMQDGTSLRAKHQDNYSRHSSLTNIDKKELQFQDDDDVDCVRVVYNKIFDLALRKSIVEVQKKYAVKQRSSNDYAIKYNDRIPSIDNNSLAVLKEDETAEYDHDKLKVYVEPGDVITYSIRVYNEGLESYDYAGIATEITDYLPSGISFKELAPESSQDWFADPQSGNEVKLIYKGNQILDPKSIENIANGNEENQYQEVRIKCVVNGNSSLVNKNLTNRAAITGEKVFNSETHIEVNNVSDRNNQPKTLDTSDLDNWYDNTVNDIDTPDRYYPGEEDDDDFETVYFNSYNLTVEKYDQNNNPLMGTEFKVSKYKYSVLNSSEIVEQEDDIQAYKNGIRANATYTGTFYNSTNSMARDAFVIKEIQSTAGHSNPFEGKYIKATAVYTNNTRHFNVYIYNEETSGQTDYISDSNRRIDQNDSIYDYIKVTQDENGLYIKIINPDTQVEGKYSLQLEKRKSKLENNKFVEGEKLAGVVFNATGTMDNRAIDIQNPLISTGKDEENVYIVKDRTIDNTKTEIYTVNETSIGTADSKCYVGLPTSASVKIIVEKDSDTTTGSDYVQVTTYKVKKAKMQLDGVDSSLLAEPATEKKAVLKNGTVIRLDDSDLSKLKLIVSNPTNNEDGKYSLQLEKRALKFENGSYSEGEKLTGVVFNAWGTVDGVKVPARDYTSRPEGVENPYVIQDKDIRKTDADVFYIKEASIGQGNSTDYYLGLPTSATIMVTVEKETEIINGSDNSQTTRYKVRDAYIQVQNLDDSFVKYRNNERIELTNGTIIRLDRSNLQNLKIVVSNPPIENEGKYSLQLEKRGLREENGEYVEGEKLAGVNFNVSGRVDGATLEVNNPIISTGANQENPYIIKDKEIRTTSTDTFYVSETSIGSENSNYYLGLPENARVGITVIKRQRRMTGSNNNEVIMYEVSDARFELIGVSQYMIKDATNEKWVLQNGTIIRLDKSDLQNLKLIVSNPLPQERGKYSVQLEKRALKLQNKAYVEGDKLAGVKFDVTGTVEGAAIPRAYPISTGDNQENPYIIKDKEIRSTNSDTFTIKEKEINANSDYYLGLPSNATININVEKDSEILTDNRYVKVKNYKVKNASISLTGADSQIKTATATKIVLKNGTIIRLDTNDLQNLKLVVSNPKKYSRGSYSVQLEKRGLIEENGTYTIGRKLPGVLFDATGTVDGVNADVPSTIPTTGYNSQDQELENVYVVEDKIIRTTQEDTFRFIERSMGTDSESKKHIIGTNGTIVLKVQKTMEEVNERDMVVKVYKPTGATIDLENVPASDIKTQTPTEIVLNNGTIIKATFDPDTWLVKLMVANPKKDLTGQYNVKLRKYDLSTASYAEGFKFDINGTEKTTSGTRGEIDVSNGIKYINKDNVDTVDEYVITEKDNNGYHKINHPITLRVSKGADDGETNYKLTNVNVSFWPNNHAGVAIDIDVSTGSASKTINAMTSDGTTIPVKISIASDGTITVTANNDVKDGSYQLEIYKTYTDTEGQRPLGGASFRVSGYSSNLTTDASGSSIGYTQKITKDITKDNWNTTDEFTIEEISTGDNAVVGLKYPVKLYVTKAETAGGYEINTIQLEDTHTGNRSAVVNGLGSQWATLNNIEIDDATGRTVTVRAKGNQNTLITIEMDNVPRVDKINVKIKKISSPSGQALPGVKFKAVRDNTNVNESTTDNSGEAYLDRDREVRKNSEFTYVITEEDIPSQPANLMKLTDFGWILNVKTKYDSTLKKYVIDRNRTTIRVNALSYQAATPEQHQRQEEIAESALNTLEVSEDGATVSFTVENQVTTSYGLTLRKADLDTNAELQDALFTVIEDGKIVASNTRIGDLANRFANNTGIVTNSTHTYEIYETEPAEGYDNILEKVYIKLVIRVDRNGNATATYTIEKKPGSTDADVADVTSKINNYVSSHSDVTSFLEKSGNNFKLNIPNPDAEIPLEIRLKKYQLGDLNKSVNGAIFGIRKLQTNDTYFNAVIGAFNSGTNVETLDPITTSRNRLEENIDEIQARIGNTYYYEVTELNVPANFSSNFYSAIIKVTVNQNKTVSSEIFAVKDTSLSAWRAYDASYDGVDYLSVNDSGSPVTIKWANELKYYLVLHKLSFEDALPKDQDGKTNWAAMPLIGGATFKVQRVSPNEEQPETITVSDAGYQRLETAIQTNTHFVYKISEITPPAGYYDTFKDMEITLSVYIDADGNISTANAVVNKVAGATVSDEDLEFARQCVGAMINSDSRTRTVYLKVANQKVKNSFNLKFLKMSTERDGQGNPIPLPGVEFRLRGPNVDFTDTTKNDGYFSLNNIEPDGHTQRYYLTELSAPNSVIRLNGTIEVVIKTQGISAQDSAEVIAQKLKTQVDTDNDGVLEDRITINYVGSDMPAGFGGFTMRETDIIVPIPNESKTFDFGLFKIDSLNAPINSSDGTPGAAFNVSYMNEDDLVISGALDQGFTYDYRMCNANSTYEYIVEEEAAKTGFVNILEGYKLHVYLRTTSEGLIADFVEPGHADIENFSHYSLERIPGKTQKYSEQEIYANEWLKFGVQRETKKSHAKLYVVNPYQYHMRLNKLDINGRTPINKAKITAERINDVDSEGLYNNSSEGRQEILKAIVDSTDISNTTILNKQETVVSDFFDIDNNIGETPKHETSQLWRIKEDKVYAPYVNVLGDKTVVVETFYRNNQLNIASHFGSDGQGSAAEYNFYVTDEDGNDVTYQYAKYIKADVQKVDGEWELNVSIKDPMEMRFGIYKTKGNSQEDPLSGAHLTVKLDTGHDDEQIAVVENGAYESEMLVKEVPIDNYAYVTITEESTARGYINILKGKELKYIFRNNGEKMVRTGIYVIDSEQQRPVSQEEREEVLRYITLSEYTTEEGYQAFKVYIQNPLEFNFKLTKKDIGGNNLEGTRISVYSTHSGPHTLSSGSELNFTEKYVKPNEVITYTIEERNTVPNSAYVNSFVSKFFKVEVTLNEGVPTITKKAYVDSHRPSEETTFDTYEGFDCYFDPSSVNDLEENELQTLTVEMVNPVQYKVELNKWSAGDTPIHVENTKFTIEDIETHTEYTDENGQINYTNIIKRPGVYNIMVSENETASSKYVNVLEGKYVRIVVVVNADGTIRLPAPLTFYDKNTGEQITGDEREKLLQYCSTHVDNSEAVKKVVIDIKDPVKYNIRGVKLNTANGELENARFKIISMNGNLGTVSDNTDSNGQVNFTEDWVKPGLYEYRVQEEQAPGAQYENVLYPNYIKFFVKVEENGDANFADKNGNVYPYYVASNNRYYVVDENGDDVDTETKVNVRKYWRIHSVSSLGVPDQIIFQAINPVQYKLDIAKKQYSNDGEHEDDLDGTKFTVRKNGSEVILDKGEVSSAVEIEEHLMAESDNYYDIFENEIPSQGAYVNVLGDKFIRVYTHVDGNGVVTIRNANGQRDDDYFEIYQPNHYGPSTVVDRATNQELYDSIAVSSVKGEDGIYTLNVKVINPISIKVGVLKKQVNGNPIPDVSLSINSDISGVHIFTTSGTANSFEENEIKPGRYNYIVREHYNPNHKYVNILENRYAKVDVSIDKTGAITVNDIKFFNSSGTAITDTETLNTLNKYVKATVDTTERIQKLNIVIENPVTLAAKVWKTDLEFNELKDATFTISRYTEDETISQRHMANKQTDDDGEIIFEDGEILDPGVYRYEVIENEPAGEQYVNILKVDGVDYKIVAYVRLKADGTTEFVKDAEGTPFEAGEDMEYYIRRVSGDGEVPEDVVERIQKYTRVFNVKQSITRDSIIFELQNPFKVDLDITKVTKIDNEEQPVAHTEFAATMDNTIELFDKEVDQNIEHTVQAIEPGVHTFNFTEIHSDPNGGLINVLEGRYVKVYTSMAADGVLTIKNNLEVDSPGYFEIYEGEYNSGRAGTLLDRNTYAKVYDCVSVEAVRQENGVYKLNVKVNNPERNYKLTLNKRLLTRDIINLRNVEFKVKSGVTGRTQTLTTDKYGNFEFEEKQVPVGVYEYLIKESKTAGPEFKNVLKNNYLAVYVKVNQDGSIDLVDKNGYSIPESEPVCCILDMNFNEVSYEDTVVDEHVYAQANNDGEEPEIHFYITNPEFYNLKLTKIDSESLIRLNNIAFSAVVQGPDGNGLINLTNAETLENIDLSNLVTHTVNGEDGVISVEDILISKPGTYTFTFHEKERAIGDDEALFGRIYKTHGEDIVIEVDVSIEYDEEGIAKEYVIGQPRCIKGARYIDENELETTNNKPQTINNEVLNTPIRGHYDLVLNKLDKYTKAPLDGAEFNITVEKGEDRYELYDDDLNLDIKNVVIPRQTSYVVENGVLTVPNIRIERPETYRITLTETKAPAGYMLLDEPIVLEVNTVIDGEYDDARFIVNSITMVSGENHGLVYYNCEDNLVSITAENEYFDLALRKSITSVAFSDSDTAKITEDETENRIPKVDDDDDLFDALSNTAEYKHVKNHARGYVGQEVIYTLRVYNEGELDGYAEEITDHLPEGLEFVNDSFNAQRGWILDYKDPTQKTVKTRFLSKENNPGNERFNAENNLIRAFNPITKVLDYKEIEIKCRIKDNLRPKTILTNIAEISLSKAEGRSSETVDRDSVVDNANVPETIDDMQQYKENELTDDRNTYVPGQEDDDDFEKIIIEEFDLALRKYITAVNEDELCEENTEEKYSDKKETNDGTNTEDENANNGEVMIKYSREPRVNVSALKERLDNSSIYLDSDEPTTATYTHTKQPVEVSVGDIVTYTLEVFNEGTVSGYASLIKDDIPEGLEFVAYNKGDGSVNDIYGWKMVDENDVEVTDPKEAKFVISEYLSKDNEETERSNLIKAFDPDTMTDLDSKYVQVQFRVICKQDYPKIITNFAQISDDSDEDGKDVDDRDSTPNEWIDEEDDQDIENIIVTYMDLALRKFITGVTDFKENVTYAIDSRIPEVDPKALIDETGTTAEYNHTKDPVLVHTNDIVIYTLRIFNEGSKNAYATQIKDNIPEGLVFLPDHPINKEYEWEAVDENGKHVDVVNNAKYIVTNYLSKENETDERQNLLGAFDYYDYENDKQAKLDTPKFKDVQIAFKVIEPQTSDRIIENDAQISEQTDGDGIHREDRDSTPNEWLGEDDEDIEKVRVQCFDLALRKWVTKAIVTQNGKTVVTETGHHAEDDPEEVVKVDIKKSKIDSVLVKFEYQIRITNEGEIAGYAKEIKDYIPQGLSFDPADNPTWTQIGDNVITTDELEDTLLQPGESAEVTVVLTWINSGTNLGLKVNKAEISKDYNDYDTPDIDSTPDNDTWGEDDIDDAPVMLAVKTGNQIAIYVAIFAGLVAIIGLGVYYIKKTDK